MAAEPLSMMDASLRNADLGALDELMEKLGVSIPCMTDSLTTAYKLSDEVFVFHQGRIVERGSMRNVIDAPVCQNSRLLIASVPEPDLDLRWRGQLDGRQEGSSVGAEVPAGDRAPFR